MILASPSAPKWFCVITNPNCQTRAQLELAAIGYRSFLPKVRRWHSHARVKKAVEKPLLGRYLFVEVDHPRQSFGAVRACNGIETLLSNLGIPSAFPSRWVEDMRMRYMAGEWDEVAKGKIPVGARVRVVEGEFDNLLATITRVKGRMVEFKVHGSAKQGRLYEHGVRPWRGEGVAA